MLKAATRNVSKSLALLVLFIGAFAPSLAAGSAIYRCGPEGSQRFSQIPCEENSEQLIVEDHPLFRETGAPGGTASAGSGEAGSSDRQSDSIRNAQAFITQLEKQRNEQLAEIDRSISELQSRAEKADDTDEASNDAEEALSLLVNIQNTRQSVVSEYEAMISAARERMENP